MKDLILYTLIHLGTQIRGEDVKYKNGAFISNILWSKDPEPIECLSKDLKSSSEVYSAMGIPILKFDELKNKIKETDPAIEEVSVIIVKHNK